MVPGLTPQIFMRKVKMVDFEVLSVSNVTRRDKSFAKGITVIGALYQKLLRFYCAQVREY